MVCWERLFRRRLARRKRKQRKTGAVHGAILVLMNTYRSYLVKPMALAPTHGTFLVVSSSSVPLRDADRGRRSYSAASHVATVAVCMYMQYGALSRLTGVR